MSAGSAFPTYGNFLLLSFPSLERLKLFQELQKHFLIQNVWNFYLVLSKLKMGQNEFPVLKILFSRRKLSFVQCEYFPMFAICADPHFSRKITRKTTEIFRVFLFVSLSFAISQLERQHEVGGIAFSILSLWLYLGLRSRWKRDIY